MPIKDAKSLPWAENFNQLFTVKGGKFKFSAQMNDLAPFAGNGTKIKIPFDIKSPLATHKKENFYIISGLVWKMNVIKAWKKSCCTVSAGLPLRVENKIDEVCKIKENRKKVFCDMQYLTTTM